MKFAVLHRLLYAASVFALTQHAVLASDANADYLLSPGDVLSVKNNNDDGTVTQAPILPDGTAVVNYAGVIKASGKTIKEVNDLVNEAGKKWFASPNIEVSLGRRRLEQIYILGEVTHPGLYPATPPPVESTGTTSKSKAPFTISKALEMAGGLKDTADLRHGHVTRLHPRMVIDVDLWKLMRDGDVKEDLVLDTGDVIYIPKLGTESGTSKDTGLVVPGGKNIRVVGAVKKPGLIKIPGDSIDLLSVIAQAGGFSEPNSTYSITIANTAEDGHVVFERVHFNRKQKSFALKSGDIVIVKATPINNSKFYPPSFFGRYGSLAFSKYLDPSPAQIEERSKCSMADINSLWQAAQHLHHRDITKKQIETAYSEFETSLQKAADELDTGEPLRSDWAVDLITCYTRPHHKWPAVSPTLDKVLQARNKLVQFTDEHTVATIEQKLYRVDTPEDKTRYYRSPGQYDRLHR